MGRSFLENRERLARGILLYALTLAAFLPSLRNGWTWDDDLHVTSNMLLRSWGSLVRLWVVLSALPQYYPLTHTVFWIEYRLLGPHPAGFHLFNVLLHGANAVLVWLLLENLQLPGAFFAAALFAAHPVQAESVLWITELKNLLSGFFTLISALAYVRWEEEGRSRIRLCVLSAACFLAALLSKTTACILPAALLLILWWKRGKIGLREILPLLPFFGAGLGFGLLTASIEKNAVGASGPEWSFAFATRVMIAGRALWFYLGKLLWPAPLVFVYPRWILDASSPAAWVWPAAALAALVLLWRCRTRLGRGPLAAALGFAGTLFPALGFINVYPMRYTFVADHYQYMAALFAFAAAAAGGAFAVRRLGPGARAAAPVFAGALLLVYAGVDWARARAFANPETLWRDTFAKNPDSWMVRCNLATSLAGEGKRDEAILWFKRTLELRPGAAEIYNDLGNAYAAEGDLGVALDYYRQSLKLMPIFPEAHNDLGSAYEQMGRTDAAAAEFEEALREDPKFAPARVNLGISLERRGRSAEAETQLRRVLASVPEYTAARLELGDIYLESRRIAQAQAEFAEAVRLDAASAEAHYNLGNALYAARGYAPAAREFQEAARLKPGWAEAEVNLGNTLAMLGRADEAEAAYRRARDAGSEHAALYLARLRKARGEAVEARR